MSLLVQPSQIILTNSPGATVPAANILNLNDAATIFIKGSDFCNVLWTVAAAPGTAKLTAEYTTDTIVPPVNWLTAPYSKEIDLVSANPLVQAWSNQTAVAGTFETPLPGNCTAFRVRVGTGGTAVSVSLTGGLSYETGVPVTATLYDVTSAVNTALNTGTIDSSGWVSASLSGFMSGVAGGTFGVNPVDDFGAVGVLGIPQWGVVTATGVAYVAQFGSSTPVGPSRGITLEALGMLPKRINASMSPVAAITGRIRIEVRR